MSGTSGSAGKLDRFARSLAQRETLSRREVVGGGAKLAAGVAASSVLWGLVENASASTVRKRCKRGEKRCEGHCRSVQTDRHNCGHCGHKCASHETCVHGRCHTACAAGTTACAGACVNLSTSPTNCGSCGHACASGQFCSNGQCQTPAPTCHDGVQNEGETDVDCGGPNCPSCAVGKHCQVMTDCVQPAAGGCTSVICSTGVCTVHDLAADSPCTANGGKLCDGSGNCVGCVTHTDCVNQGDGACVAGVCQQPSCSDGIQNEGETDIDCGGPNCPPCAVGKTCTQKSDCAQPAAGGCTDVLCTAGACTSTPLAAESMCSEGGSVCDGSGNCVACVTPSDCPAPVNNPCENAACSQNVCGFAPAPNGTSCGPSMTCDGAGHCVS